MGLTGRTPTLWREQRVFRLAMTREPLHVSPWHASSTLRVAGSAMSRVMQGTKVVLPRM